MTSGGVGNDRGDEGSFLYVSMVYGVTLEDEVEGHGHGGGDDSC